jgi:hypothetical protein
MPTTFTISGGTGAHRLLEQPGDRAGERHLNGNLIIAPNRARRHDGTSRCRYGTNAPVTATLTVKPNPVNNITITPTQGGLRPAVCSGGDGVSVTISRAASLSARGACAELVSELSFHRQSAQHAGVLAMSPTS